MIDRAKVIEELEDLEPYARDLPCVNVRGGLFLDTLELLKQEQVKPFKESVGPYNDYNCGNCGAGIQTRWKYCPICGMAVKWDDYD